MAWQRGRAYAQDLRERVLAVSGRLREVAERFGGSPSYVSRARTRRSRLGQVSSGSQCNHVPLRLDKLKDSLLAQVALAPAGKTPLAKTIGGTRQKPSMIVTVTNQGKTRWMIIDDAFDAGKKVFVILVNLRVHHSKIVKACVAERRAQIELFYLPNYSPQLNSEECLSTDLKQDGQARTCTQHSQITRCRQRVHVVA